MGAAFDGCFVNVPDRAEAEQKFYDIQEIDRYENGHSYSGTIGMASGIKFRNEQKFSCVVDAESWVERNAEKWGPALAVRVKNDTHDGWMIGAICSS